MKTLRKTFFLSLFALLGARGEGVSEEDCYWQEVLGAPVLKESQVLQDIVDEVEENYFQSVLPEKVKFLRKGKRLRFDVNLEGVNVPLVFSFQMNGRVRDIKIINERERKRLALLGIKLKKKSLQEGGRKYWVLVKESQGGDEEITLVAFFPPKRVKNLSQDVAVYVNFNGQFEKSVYHLEMSDLEGTVEKAKPRKRFPKELLSISQTGEMARGSAPFKNAIFKVFYSRKRRENLIRSELSSEVNDVLEEFGYQSPELNQKVEGLIESVVENVRSESNKFRGGTNDLTSMTMKESIILFEELLPLFVRDYVEGMDPEEIKKLSHEPLNSLRACLEEAARKKNSEESVKCVDHFMIQVPVDMGEKIFTFELEKNDAKELAPESLANYRKCINEKYYHRFVKEDGSVDYKEYRSLQLKTNPANIVQGCLTFSAIGLPRMLKRDIEKGQSNLLDREIDRALKTMPDFELSFSQKDKLETLDVVEGCFKKRGIGNDWPYWNDDSLFARLQEMKVNTFKNHLNECMEQGEEFLTRKAASTLMARELDSDKVPSALKAKAHDKGMEEYNRCVRKLSELPSAPDISYCQEPVTVNIFETGVEFFLNKVPQGEDRPSPELVSKTRKCLQEVKKEAYGEFELKPDRTQKVEGQIMSCLSDEKLLLPILRSALGDLLEKVQLTKSQEEELIGKTATSLETLLENANNFNEALGSLSELEKKTISEGIDLIFRSKLEGVIELEDPQEKKKRLDSLMKHADQHLLTGGPGYRKVISDLVADGRYDEVEKTVDLIVKHSIDEMAGQVIRVNMIDLLDQGFFENEKSMEEFSLEMKDGIMKCLQEGKEEENQDEVLDRCSDNQVLEGAKKIVFMVTDKYLNSYNITPPLKEKYTKMIENQFSECVDRKDDRFQSMEAEFRWKSCLMSQVPGLVESVHEDVRKENPSLFKPTGDAQRFKQCYQKIKDKVGQHFEISSLKEDPVLMYAVALEKGKSSGESGEMGVDWYLDRVTGCLVRGTLLDLVEDYKIEDANEDGENRDTSLLVKLKESLLETFKDEGGVHLAFDLPLSSPSLSGDVGGEEDLSQKLMSLNSMFLEYIDVISEFDKQEAVRGLEKLKESIREEAKKSDGKITVRKLNSLLAESELMTLIIEGVVVSEMKKSIFPTLVQNGVSEEKMSSLISKEMIQKNLRNSSGGKRAISQIKEKYISSLLSFENESDSSDALERATREIEKVFIRDDETGGFVETIFYDIVDGRLKEKLSSLTEGDTMASMFNRWVMKYYYGYEDQDFQWGEPRNLRKTCGGRFVVKAFARYVVEPMVLEKKEFTDEELDEIAEDRIEPFLKQAMEETTTVESLRECR